MTKRSIQIRLCWSTLVCLALLACGSSESSEPEAQEKAAPPADQLPRFNPDSELYRPEGWEAWVLAGTSMGLGYSEPTSTLAPGDPPGAFLNVYIQPWAYERFMETGSFPEGTMFVLAGSDPERKANPALRGFYQGPISLMEVHLKREGLHESGWGFYGFGNETETAAMIPGNAPCYACHRDEAAYDNAFVQFYPAIRERLGIETLEADSTGGAS